MEYKKINKKNVRPISNHKLNKDEIKGGDLFEEIYSNIFICAKKKSGKTSLIWTILKECSGRDTTIIIFAATATKDNTYKHIKKHFKKKGNTVITYNSIKDGKVDQLAEILSSLRTEEESDSEKEFVEQYPIVFTDEMLQQEAQRARKEKYKAPELIFVFDDLSAELRTNSVATLLKSNRHYKCKVLLSSQYPMDLKPESIRQMDYVILFGGHDDAKLEKFHRDLDLSIPIQKFIDIYKEITKEKYKFLYIDVINETLRRNLNEQIIF